MSGYKVCVQTGESIQRIRKKKNISQEDFAEMIGVHRNHIGRIERGETNVPLYTLYKIAKALKVKSSEILPF